MLPRVVLGSGCMALFGARQRCRQRVVAIVEEGHSHHAAAAQFRVSVTFVNDMVILKRETGGLEPRAQGNGGDRGKLVSLRG